MTCARKTRPPRLPGCVADGSTKIKMRGLALRKHAVTAREALKPANRNFFNVTHIVTDVVCQVVEGKVRIRLLQCDLLASRQSLFLNAAQGIKHSWTRPRRNGPDGKDKRKSRVLVPKQSKIVIVPSGAILPAEFDCSIANQEARSICGNRSHLRRSGDPWDSTRPPEHATAPRSCAKRDPGKSFRCSRMPSGSPRSRCKLPRDRQSQRRQQSVRHRPGEFQTQATMLCPIPRRKIFATTPPGHPCREEPGSGPRLTVLN